MPRGIYDRTKTKEQRATEKKPEKKSAKAAAPKRKYTKKAAQSVVVVTNPLVKAYASDQVPYYKHASLDHSFFLLTEARSNLAVLMQVAEKFGDMPTVKDEVEAHVGIIGQLREMLFTVNNSVDSSEVSANEMVDEEVLPAPNGTISARQTSVPLPPPPPVAPALPTH